jgi:hypothetical protein
MECVREATFASGRSFSCRGELGGVGQLAGRVDDSIAAPGIPNGPAARPSPPRAVAGDPEDDYQSPITKARPLEAVAPTGVAPAAGS